MGSEQSTLPPKKQAQRAPPVRRGHTIAVPNASDSSRSTDLPASGNNSPGTSICSDSELPYISYTVDRPIGDSPKASAKSSRGPDNKKSVLQRRQLSLQARKSKRTRDIVVVKQPTDELLDEHIQRLQEISTFLPIMRGTLGLPGARDPEVLEGLDYRPWVRVTSRLQAHLAACAHPLADIEVGLAGKIREVSTTTLTSHAVAPPGLDYRPWVRVTSRLQAHLAACAHPLADIEVGLAGKIREADGEITRLYSIMVEKQRSNARHAERLARVHEVSHQLTRCNSLLNQTLQDIEELNALLPEDKRLEPFVWSQ